MNQDLGLFLLYEQLCLPLIPQVEAGQFSVRMSTWE